MTKIAKIALINYEVELITEILEQAYNDRIGHKDSAVIAGIGFKIRKALEKKKKND